MKRFAGALAVTLGLAVIGSVVSLVPQKNAVATGSAPVTIMNTATNAVPVTGSVSANITNTSVVPVSGSVGVSGTVNVANTTPLQFVNVGDPGRIPYQSNMTMFGCPNVVGTASDVCNFDFAPVPQGMRLVVLHVSGSLNYNSGTSSAGPVFVSVPTTNTVAGTLSSFIVSPAGQTFALFDQTVQLYFDQGQVVEVQAQSPGTTFVTGPQQLTLTGYLLDCTAAPCASIAH